MASLFPAKGEGEGGLRGDEAGSAEEGARALGASSSSPPRRAESPGPGSDSGSRSPSSSSSSSSSSPSSPSSPPPPSPSPSLREQFERAAARVAAAAAAASKEQLLYLYARYKQVKCGSCNTPKPGFFDFEGKQKWEAWKQLGDTSPEQAMREYVATVKKLDPTWNPQSGTVLLHCQSLGIFLSSTIWLKSSISQLLGSSVANSAILLPHHPGPGVLPIFVYFIATVTSSDMKGCTGPKTWRNTWDWQVWELFHGNFLDVIPPALCYLDMIIDQLSSLILDTMESLNILSPFLGGFL